MSADAKWIPAFRATGKVTTMTDRRRIGRRRHLTFEDVAVCTDHCLDT